MQIFLIKPNIRITGAGPFRTAEREYENTEEQKIVQLSRRLDSIEKLVLRDIQDCLYLCSRIPFFFASLSKLSRTGFGPMLRTGCRSLCVLEFDHKTRFSALERMQNKMNTDFEILIRLMKEHGKLPSSSDGKLSF